MIKIALILTFVILFSFWKHSKPKKSSRRVRSTAPYVPKPPGDVRPTKGELDCRAVGLKEILLQLYTPKYPFRLAVSDMHPKRRLGTYFPDRSRIIVYARNTMGMRNTAIHEYAHHITETEIGFFPRRHGKMFKRTYSQLIDIYNSTHQPQIVPDSRYYIKNNKPIF